MWLCSFICHVLYYHWSFSFVNIFSSFFCVFYNTLYINGSNSYKKLIVHAIYMECGWVKNCMLLIVSCAIRNFKCFSRTSNDVENKKICRKTTTTISKIIFVIAGGTHVIVGCKCLDSNGTLCKYFFVFYQH